VDEEGNIDMSDDFLAHRSFSYGFNPDQGIVGIGEQSPATSTADREHELSTLQISQPTARIRSSSSPA
jgi:hypothetical protein